MEFVPAPFWRRLVARVIDLLVCVPLTFVAVCPIAVLMVPLMFVVSDGATSSLGAFLCFSIAYTLVEYFLLRRRSGQTLGKGLLGLRVLNADEVPPAGDMTGDSAGDFASAPPRPLSARSALLRMAVLIGPLMLSLAAFYLTYDDDLGTSESVLSDVFLWIWVATLAISALTAVVGRATRRGLHDMAAGTRVVRAQPRGIDLRKDLAMLVPGRVSLEKDAPPPPVVMTKQQ